MISTIQIRSQHGVIVATLPPETDLNNIQDVRTQLIASLHASATALIIDLSNSTYLDSKGIRLLMELEQHLQTSQQPFRLVVPLESHLARLLDIAGVPIARDESVAAALQSILRTTTGPPKTSRSLP